MEQEKQVVYFSDLFFAVLKRWKSMLILAVVLALVLGGYGYLNSRKPVTDDTAANTTASISYKKQQVSIISDNILNQQKYMTDSVLMTMNPYDCGKITTDVYVDTNYQIQPDLSYQNTDKTVAVMRSYATVILSREAVDSYCAATGIAAGYVTELISTEIITNSNMLSITVHCPDMDTAQKLNDAVVAQLQSAKTVVTDLVTDHEIAVISTPSTSPVAQDVVKAQADAAQRLTNLRLSLTETKTELSALQNAASDARSASTLILAVIGAFAGVFLVAAFAVVQHLVSNRIYSARVLENRTDLRILGALPQKVTRLHKAEGRATEAKYDVLAMNIRNYCGEENRVLLLGELSEEHKTALAEQLQKLGITATFGGSLLTTAASMDQLRSSNAVVLIYTCGKSLYTHAEKEIRMVGDQEKLLSGCILIDG